MTPSADSKFGPSHSYITKCSQPCHYVNKDNVRDVVRFHELYKGIYWYNCVGMGAKMVFSSNLSVRGVQIFPLLGFLWRGVKYGRNGLTTFPLSISCCDGRC
jgi:hypothetical protein